MRILKWIAEAVGWLITAWMVLVLSGLFAYMMYILFIYFPITLMQELF